MKNSVLSLFAVALFAISAQAEDQGYRFSLKNSRCENARGEPGWNPRYVGECGDFRGIDLTDYEWDFQFNHANLIGSNFRGANLTLRSFGRSNLSFADLRDTNLSATSFAYADLSFANLEGAFQVEKVYVKSITRFGYGTDLRGARMIRTSLRGLNLYLSDELENANLTFADLRGFKIVNFQELKFEEATWSSARYDIETRLQFDALGADKRGMVYVDKK